jgi:hypothetical protein
MRAHPTSNNRNGRDDQRRAYDDAYCLVEAQAQGESALLISSDFGN